MKKNGPAFQLYAADFYMDTASWTIEEVGIYTRLLFYQWVNGSIPMDEKRLSRIAGCSPKSFPKWWDQVKLKFSPRDNENLVNLRLEETRIQQEEFRNMRVLGGKMTAEKRWGKKIDDSSANSSANSSGVALQSSSSTSINNTPLTPRKKRGDEYDEDFKTFWSEYPKKAKKPNAYREWKKLGSRRPEIGIILAAIRNQLTWRSWIEGYIPDPERWLKNERWMDEPPPNTGGGNGRTRTDYSGDKRSTVQDKIEADLARADALYAASKAAAARRAGGDAGDNDVPDFQPRRI